MLSKMFKLSSEEKGSAILLFSFLFVVILGMAGVVIDGGMLYQARSSLKKTANDAVLSGAQLFLKGSTDVTAAVNTVLSAENETTSLQGVDYKPSGASKVTVSLKKGVPTYFMKLFNVKNVTVGAKSTALIATTTSAINAVPLGINGASSPTPGTEYTLKVDAGDSAVGTFGVLALSGTGATLYQQDLENGFPNLVSINDTIYTQTGNIQGKTIEAINYRVDSSPYADGDWSHPDDPRILCILVYTPAVVESGQVKSVTITGFAYFYINAPMKPGDSSISGTFLNMIGINSVGISESATNYGAYGVKLVE